MSVILDKVSDFNKYASFSIHLRLFPMINKNPILALFIYHKKNFPLFKIK
jgi:hypothetical protein